MDVAGEPALCPSLKDAREGAAAVRTNKPSRRERVMREHNIIISGVVRVIAMSPTNLFDYN